MLQALIAMGRGLQQIVVSNVHHQELVTDKPEAVGSGRQRLTSKLKRRLRQKVALIFLLDGSRVAGCVHKNSQRIVPIGEVDPGRIA